VSLPIAAWKGCGARRRDMWVLAPTVLAVAAALAFACAGIGLLFATPPPAETLTPAPFSTPHTALAPDMVALGGCSC
jgi:hypothetical protein